MEELSLQSHVRSGVNVLAIEVVGYNVNITRQEPYTIGWSESSRMNRNRRKTQALAARRLVNEPPTFGVCLRGHPARNGRG